MDVDSDAAPVVGPKPIRKLAADVVNRIAAAEIIHRPSNAVKELVENALDAGSTSIKVTVKEGGLKLLQITDNGHGVNRADLPLLCERYATSKLTKFEDLQAIATFGFRGEALASISYCSHLEVVTKTRADTCGWKAQYADGVLKGDARPTAANDGTTVSAADLFYNMPLRKRAFRSASDEYARILDVVSKYAVHNPHAGWVCKKAGSALPDVSTAAGSTAKANIGLLYTPALAAELLEVEETAFPKLGGKVRGWVSNANSNWARKGGWLLFINNRLVDSSKIKKAIDGLYTTYLPKGASPFVYLALELDPANVDVNVHPTKSEVHFLHEDEVVEAVVAAVEKTLAGANTSRTFTVQTMLPGADALDKRERERDAPRAKAAPNYKVRMDPTNRTLDSMITVVAPSQISHERPAKRRIIDPSADVVLADDDTPLWNAREEGRDAPESECDFTSIQELRGAVRKRASPDLTETIAKHAFVGLVDRTMCLSLIQHQTRLLLVNHAAMGDEHFYQLGLRQFGAFGRLKLEPAPKLEDLLRIAAEDEPLAEHGLAVDEVVAKCTALLLSKADMIDEYFSLSFAEGEVRSLPILLKGYTPNLDRLPHLLLCLATRVDWEDEKDCFESVLRELAFFYSPRPFDDEDEDEDAEEAAHQAWQLEHVLFPSFRRTQWPRSMSTDVSQVANLPDLFRVFERC
ncbi:DNA mismatch repair protein MutL [Cutaneotrichosporon oleaginosum]|uniref:DNA mismatch repair protein MutL n=1 Tax=Cutaneotrichosporon oleaginosum TaxID=879819 RepID=A0A0J1AX90_9TREE|nr:DNA mismatch repair protein MutL [Cutaneotrichosporon oleaginosum]KLT39914.1 DNA mismatch repair protein MutL [Cutaneotrichosporon oleaginosum]TXT08328.1 hypothetical protein COLE_05252 [Cutaneotrichosporon oleaginosum]